MKEHWDEMLRQYPDNSIPRMCEGIIGLVTAELEATRENFSPSIRSSRAASKWSSISSGCASRCLCQERWKDLLRGSCISCVDRYCGCDSPRTRSKRNLHFCSVITAQVQVRECLCYHTTKRTDHDNNST